MPPLHRSLRFRLFASVLTPPLALSSHSFDVGDLVVVDKIWADADQDGWCNGLCERTERKVRHSSVLTRSGPTARHRRNGLWLTLWVSLMLQGDFPSANVFVLPHTTRPDEDVLKMFAAYLAGLSPPEEEF